MSNNITIELCAEDRARLDRLAEALERQCCERCVQSALKTLNDLQKQAEPDPVQQKLAEVLADTEKAPEAPQEPAEAKETEAPAIVPTEDETPATEAQASEAAPAVTVDDIRQRYVALVASGKKDKARDTIKSYNVDKISDIPADKCAEVLAKLNALGG